MSGKLRQAARKLADSIVAAAQPFRWAVQVKTTTNRQTTGLVEVERVGTGQEFWAQVRNSVYLAAGDLVWVVKDPSAQGNWIFDGFVTGAGTGESLNGSPIPSVQTPIVTSPDGTPLIIRPIAGQQGTIGRVNETINFAGAINVAQGITFAALGAGIVQSSAGGVLSSDYTIDATTTWATGTNILPADASGQDLGDATHRWDLHTQELRFEGAAENNFIIIPDNVADAFMLYDAGDLEYLRIHSTDAQPIVVFNDAGADIDFIIEASGVANALVVQGSDGQVTMGGSLLVSGTVDIGLFTNTVAGGDSGLTAHIVQGDDDAMTGTLRGAYISASNGDEVATGTIRGIEIKGRAGYPGETGANVNVLEGFSVSSDAKTYDVTVHRGGEIILDGGAGTSTLAVCLRLANNFQANRATTSYGLQIYYDSFAYTADIQLSDGSTIMDYAQGFGINFTTAIAQTGMIGINNTRFLHTYGANNLFMGASAGNFTLTGDQNTAVGFEALAALTTGARNACFGYQAGNAITEGNANMLIGRLAGLRITVGDNNVCVGNAAGWNITSGINNFCLGNVSGIALTTGSHNVLIGVLCGKSLTAGQHNVFIGANAGELITTGQENIAIGKSALAGPAGAINGVVAIGRSAMLAATNAAGNATAIGYKAAYNLDAANGVFIGYQAGYENTTGANNILIGYQAGDIITTGASNIIIGHDIDPTAAGASNEINIGGVYFGDTSTGIAWLKNKLIFTQADGDEYIDSLADGYMDYRATTAHRFGDGTNQLLISGAGVVTLEGTAKRWLAVRPDLDYTVITAQGKPAQVVIGVFHGYSMPIWNDAANSDEQLFFNLNVPGRWDEASDIIVHLLVALSGAEDVNDNFNFQLSWEHLTEGDVVPATSHDVEVEQAVLAARNAQYSTYELQFTLDYDVDDPDDVADHDDLSMRLRRIDATNPDVTNEIIVLDYHVEFQVNKMFDAEAA